MALTGQITMQCHDFFLILKMLSTVYLQQKRKLRKLRVHKTGGGPAPCTLTRIEEAVARILGKTPEFAGVVQRLFGDSRVVMKRGTKGNDMQARICNAEMVGETSNLVHSMNTSKKN